MLVPICSAIWLLRGWKLARVQVGQLTGLLGHGFHPFLRFNARSTGDFQEVKMVKTMFEAPNSFGWLGGPEAAAEDSAMACDLHQQAGKTILCSHVVSRFSLFSSINDVLAFSMIFFMRLVLLCVDGVGFHSSLKVWSCPTELGVEAGTLHTPGGQAVWKLREDPSRMLLAFDGWEALKQLDARDPNCWISALRGQSIGDFKWSVLPTSRNWGGVLTRPWKNAKCFTTQTTTTKFSIARWAKRGRQKGQCRPEADGSMLEDFGVDKLTPKMWSNHQEDKKYLKKTCFWILISLSDLGF